MDLTAHPWLLSWESCMSAVAGYDFAKVLVSIQSAMHAGAFELQWRGDVHGDVMWLLLHVCNGADFTMRDHFNSGSLRWNCVRTWLQARGRRLWTSTCSTWCGSGKTEKRTFAGPHWVCSWPLPCEPCRYWRVINPLQIKIKVIVHDAQSSLLTGKVMTWACGFCPTFARNGLEASGDRAQLECSAHPCWWIGPGET